jgi:uncharacterized Ntn-hydrolase superfamily protein
LAPVSLHGRDDLYGGRMTFSIVAADPATGEVGCAVQSRYLAIGAVTPWVRAGTGAVATQADGRAAAVTGRDCAGWAGHLVEHGVAVQGNTLASADVLPAMRRAFHGVVAPLPERMLAALEAAQAAGGDRRGQQAAAIVVEQLGAAQRSREGVDRVCDLRVDDHLEPIAELRRLLTLWRRRQTERGLVD